MIRKINVCKNILNSFIVDLSLEIYLGYYMSVKKMTICEKKYMEFYNHEQATITLLPDKKTVMHPTSYPGMHNYVVNAIIQHRNVLDSALNRFAEGVAVLVEVAD